MKVLLFVGFLVIVLLMLVSGNVQEGYTVDDNITWLTGIKNENNTNKDKKMSEIKASRSNTLAKDRIQQIIDNHDSAPENTKINGDTKLRIAIDKLQFKKENCPTINNS